VRDRRDDIQLLVNHFLEKYAGENKTFSRDAMTMLQNYRWKGKVRELENIIERVLLLSEGDIMDVESLPEEIRSGPSTEKVSISYGGIDMEAIMSDMEKAYLLKALEKTNGVKTEAARLLNLTFRSFRHKLKKYGIDKKIITD
jgi:two-component system response regulator PilR (NtrC family)